MKLAASLACILLAGCRAPPIPVSARYPAGTSFVPHYVRVNGTMIRYIDAGRGSPVVFIHGLGGSIYAWRKTVGPVLAAGFRVIAFDNRGFGFSDKPAQGYTNAEYASLAVGFMDSLGLADAVLVGHSMGGAIAAEVAIAYPRRVRGLVLIDAAGRGIRSPLLLRIATWPWVEPVLSGLRSRWITGRVLRSTYADPREVQGEDIDQYYAPVAEPDFGRALRGVLRELRFDALGGRLAGVQAPALVLWGDQDRWIPPRLGMALASELPHVAFVLIQHAGHAAPEEEAESLNRVLIAFLKEGVPKAPANLALAASPSRR